MVDNVEPIQFVDDAQLDQYDGEAQMVSNNIVIITLALLTKGVSKETIVHVGSPQ